MELVSYYITTLTNAFKNLAPYAIFFIGGYFVFIKMPFLFLKKSLDQQKKHLKEDPEKPQIVEEKKYKIEDYKASHRQQSKMNDDSFKEQKKKPEPPKPPRASSQQTPEEILGFKVNEVVLKEDLKKRYFELLKQNHPDRVASMGEDFKKLAEKNTKEINQAYEKLKKKAA